MNKETIYFVFTDTGTNLSRIINYYTKNSLNHVSIAFDEELSEVYSFGRTQPRNPFSGGFVQEDIESEFLKNANCAVYSYDISKEEVEIILRNIKKIEASKEYYRYNFMGLIGIILQIEIKRKKAFFCSEFVATMLTDAESVTLSKPNCFITPEDIRKEVTMELLYQGKLSDYRHHSYILEKGFQKESELVTKQSFIILLSKKVRQFVIR